MNNDVRKKIDVTANHIKLLRHAIVQWQPDEYGAPEIDPKRPYGNSDVEGDLEELLPHLDEEERRQVHKETADVLQILFQFGDLHSIEGKYYQPKFEYLKWTKEE